ncbi:hypothetical protein ANCCAN_04838 [Ancylostoma caninum]|uniref:Cytoplasmic dynein 2 light intermediate chain 1 n=1 Tax=Ancylostoma caninum TaxID=29170 RepID=A0A368GXL0_ANCCA|nr:hypothetical protein ANCCAN_04838 [Ancylostoma caninum]
MFVEIAVRDVSVATTPSRDHEHPASAVGHDTLYSSTMMDMWAMAKEKLQQNAMKTATLDEKMDERTSDGAPRKTTTHIVICGVSQSGKSVLVNKFLDRNEEPRETTALEYIYARRTRGNHKDVCHIWELGGGTKFAQLLAIPLVKRNIEATSLVVVLDLTRPNELWITMEQLLTTAGQVIESAMKELDQHGRDAMKSRLNARTSDYKDDVRMCLPFPIPLLIIGSKYDEFQNFDSEQRRKICATLRFLAHYYGAHLMFYSSYNEQLVRVGRSFLSHFAFATSVPKTKVDDHNKPIYVVCGIDTFESIGPPPIDTASFSRAGQPLHLWKQAFSDHFPQMQGQILYRIRKYVE